MTFHLWFGSLKGAWITSKLNPIQTYAHIYSSHIHIAQSCYIHLKPPIYQNLTLCWFCFRDNIEPSNTLSKQCPPWISSPMCQLMQWWPLIFSRIAPKLLLKSLANLSLLGPFSLLPSPFSLHTHLILLLFLLVFLLASSWVLFVFVMGVTCLMILLWVLGCFFNYSVCCVVWQFWVFWHSFSLFKCHVCVV